MKERVYVGTYTEEIHFASGKVVKGKGEGIYVLEFDCETGRLTQTDLVRSVVNPSYMAISEDKRFLYAVNERKESNGVLGGTVSAFSINPDGSLAFLNRRYTRGIDPCYVTAGSQTVYVCNYGSGSAAVYPVLKDGSLGEMQQFIQLEGSGAHPTRQTGPHAHSMIIFDGGKRGGICDLGSDRIEMYSIEKNGNLVHDSELSIESAKGAGPRHDEFSPDGQWLYVINELNSTISVYLYEKGNNRFVLCQNIPTLEEEDAGGNTCADIHVSANGKYVYGSNRGNGTIAVYKREENGLLSRIQTISSGGDVPRSFALTGDGNYLIAANQNSDNLTVFRVREDGSLIFSSEYMVGTPVCIKMISLAD